MNRAHSIRPELVKAYHVHDRASWSDRLAVLRERDARYKALNALYGIDSTSYHGQPDPAYDRRYKEIDAEFDPQYALIGKQEREWAQRSDMTIPEYLFLDNFTSELKIICARPDFETLHYFSFIEAKAQTLIARWKAEFSYAGMRPRVEMEIEDFRFARKRCWKHFAFQLWDMDAWKQVRVYRRIYARSLRNALGRSRLA